MLIRSIEGRTPRFGRRVFVAETATVVGDVALGDDVSLWYGVVVRGDIHWVRVGARSNLQDGVVVHVENGQWPTVLGEEVSVGHGAILHGCTIGPRCLIGMGAIVMNGAEIGEGSIVAAGAVVREGFVAPPRSLVAGVPAGIKRSVSEEEYRRVVLTAEHYLEYKTRYLAGAAQPAEPVELSEEEE